MPRASRPMLTATLLSLSLLAAGGAEAKAPPQSAAAAAKRAKAFEGIWRSRGYGYVVEVGKSGTRVFDVTTTTCLAQPAEAGYAKQLLQRAKLAPDGTSFTTRAPYGLTTLYFDRVTSKPAACVAPARNPADPFYNFDVFFETMRDEYAFFAQRGVDWDALGREFRGKITPETTDAALNGSSVP